MIRKTPIKRHTALKRSPLKRSYTPIKKQGDSLAEDLEAYFLIRADYLEKNSECLVKTEHCSHIATQIHHMMGRGIYLLVIEFFLPICEPCHQFIGDHSQWAYDNGFSLKRNSKRYFIDLQKYKLNQN